MAWQIRLSDTAEKQLSRLDRKVAKRIYDFLRDRIAKLDDARSLGEALRGSKLGEFWKYRVGDYRIITSIEDDVMTILVIAIGNIYRGV